MYYFCLMYLIYALICDIKVYSCSKLQSINTLEKETKVRFYSTQINHMFNRLQMSHKVMREVVTFHNNDSTHFHQIETSGISELHLVDMSPSLHCHTPQELPWHQKVFSCLYFCLIHFH